MKFNPEYPSANDPNYLGYSKGIEQPKADTTLGTLFQGIGNVLGNAVQGVDTLIKSDIKQTAYEQVDAERDMHTKTLETILQGTARAGQAGAYPGYAGGRADIGDPNEAYAQATSEDIKPTLTPETTQMPYELSNMNGSVENLQSALDSGKVTPTYYYARLATIAKDLRSKYPGYRDYIDHSISSITGVNPANAYAASLMRDINATQGKSNWERTQALSILNKHSGEIGAPAMLQGFLAGRYNYQDIFTWGAKFDFQKARQTQEKIDREEKQAKGEATDKEDMRMYDRIAREDVHNFTTSVQLAGGFRTLDQISDLIRQHNMGGPQLSSEDWVRLGEALSSAKVTVRQSLLKKYQEQGYKFPTKDMNSIIDENLKFIDFLASRVSAKDMTGVDSAARHAKAMTDDTTLDMFNDSTLGDYVKLMAAGQGMGPQVAQRLFETNLLRAPNLNNNMKAFVQWEKLKAVNPNSRNILRLNTQPTLNQTLDEGMRKRLIIPTTAKELVRFSDVLEDSGAPAIAKESVAQWLFDPNNTDTLEKFQRDSYDQQGRYIPGRMWVFSYLGSYNKAKSILEQLRPETQRNYLNWMDNSFGNILLRDAIQDLNKYSQDHRIALGWNTKNHTWSVLPMNRMTPGGPALGQADLKPKDSITEAELHDIQKTLDTLNIGTTTLANVARAAGKEDIDGYVMHKLEQFGYQPGQFDPFSTVPQKMLDAIVAPKMQDRVPSKQMNPAPPENPIVLPRSPFKTPERTMPFSDEGAQHPVTLQEFLKNPDSVGNDVPIINRAEVPSSSRVWGDREAEAAGLYEPAKPRKKK